MDIVVLALLLRNHKKYISCNLSVSKVIVLKLVTCDSPLEYNLNTANTYDINYLFVFYLHSSFNFT